MHKANLWIINYSILIIKADNKPAISLPVYFKFVKKWKYVLRKKKKKKKRMFPIAGVEPTTTDVKSERVIYRATTANIEFIC